MIIIAKKLITPITKLTEATKRVGQEDFPENLNITRKDEIGQLATSFQSMIHKLSEMIDYAKNLSVMSLTIFKHHYKISKAILIYFLIMNWKIVKEFSTLELLKTKQNDCLL